MEISQYVPFSNIIFITHQNGKNICLLRNVTQEEKQQVKEERKPQKS